MSHQTAIFRQVNKEMLAAHHDALGRPDGRTVLLTFLCEGQAATVLRAPGAASHRGRAQAGSTHHLRGLKVEDGPE